MKRDTAKWEPPEVTAELENESMADRTVKQGERESRGRTGGYSHETL
jgi:hypothetical protein